MDEADHKSTLPPWVDAAPYLTLAAQFPNEWAAIVSLYHTAVDDVHAPECTALFQSSNAPQMCATSFACNICHKSFATRKAMLCHSRSQHKVRSEIVKRIGDTSMCPVCGTDFKSRLRLITHIGETRVRSVTRGASCRTLFSAALNPLVDEVELERLNDVDRQVRRAAKAKGHTHELAKNLLCVVNPLFCGER